MNISEFDGFFDAFTDWLQPVVVYNVAITTVDFEEVATATPRTIDAVIQPENANTLKIETIDHSLDYISLHTNEFIDHNEFVVYNGKNYRVITFTNWGDYSFRSVICEEYKKQIKGV